MREVEMIEYYFLLLPSLISFLGFPFRIIPETRKNDEHDAQKYTEPDY